MTASRALGWLIGGFIAIQSLLRCVFVGDLVRRGPIDADVIGAAMLAGLANDLLALLLVALPPMLAAALFSRRSNVSRRLFAALLALGVGVTLLIALGDVLFWFEFGSRADGLVCCNTGWPDALRSVFVDPRAASSRRSVSWRPGCCIGAWSGRGCVAAGTARRQWPAGLSLVIHGMGIGQLELLVAPGPHRSTSRRTMVCSRSRTPRRCRYSAGMGYFRGRTRAPCRYCWAPRSDVRRPTSTMRRGI
jgi:hypothetical protein